MAEVHVNGRIDILSEEQDYAAQTESYLLKLKQVKDFYPTGKKGWMATIYFKLPSPNFTANTHVYETREQALSVGTDLMNEEQKKLEAAMQQAQELAKQQGRE